MSIKGHLLLSGLISSTIISALTLISSSVSADDVVDNVSITVPVSCTMSGTGMNTHTAEVVNGTYRADIGTTTIKAFCNDPNGFSIYAIGFTGDEYTGTDHTKLIGTNDNTKTIATGTATSGSTSNWAMKLATNSGATYPITLTNGYGFYSNVPDTYTKVAQRTSGTDTGESATGSELTTTYAAFVSSTQAADTYVGKVKYTLVHPYDAEAPAIPLSPTECPANSICYAPNSSDIVGSMDSISSTKIASSATAGVQTGVSSNSTATLIAPNYSRSGYGFAGWSTDFEADNSSIIYGPNQTITTSTSGTGDADVSSHGLILYPVWIASSGNLQNWSNCSSLTQAPAPSSSSSPTLSSMTALTDERDGNVYTVARLSDGKCWMTENLRLEAEDTRGATNQSLAQGYGDDTANNRGKFIGLADSEDTNFSSTVPTAANNATNSIYSSDGSTEIDIGTVNYPAYRIPRYNNNNTNMASNATNSAGTTLTDSYNISNDHVRWHGYGNYYNWPAAIANTTHNGTNNTSTDNTSLCPTGWRLPKGGDKNNITNSDFWNLVVVNLNAGTLPANYDSSNYPYYTGNPEGTEVSKLVRNYPNNIVFSGYFDGSSAYSRSTDGYYWSSTALSSYRSYYLGLYSSSVYPGTNYYNKYDSYSVRCLLGS